MVCVSVFMWLLETPMSLAKTAEPIGAPFWGENFGELYIGWRC